MSPKEVATLLNVSQAQIARVLEQEDTKPGFVLVSRRYDLECWSKEMRYAEMYLRLMPACLSVDAPRDGE